jgi:alpha-beta hydrolase superfamily lysophospholipase
MQASSFMATFSDGATGFVYRWSADGPAKAVVQIVHGLAEHAARYGRAAQALTAAGYTVYAQDLRGHGRTAATPADLGYFAAPDGWNRCEADLWEVNRRIAADHPGLPIILLGHSLGSFLVQHFISEHGEALAGAVLSGSDGKPPAILPLGRAVARFERWRLGARGRSRVLHALLFGAFNKSFTPARTPFDWLSRDTAEVDAYIADPLCGFASSVQLAIDMFDALADIANPARQARILRRHAGPGRHQYRAVARRLSRRRDRQRHGPFLPQGTPRNAERDQSCRGY